MSGSIETVATIDFDASFMPRKASGERQNTGITSLVANTVQITATQASERLQLGQPTKFASMGAGRGMRLDFGRFKRFELYQSVSSWTEINFGHEQEMTHPEYPLLPQVSEIRRLLEGERISRSCSIQRLSSGNWEHHCFDQSIEEINLESAAMLLLQIDVVCREQRFPRGRQRIDCERGIIWFWVSQLEKLMMIITQPNAKPEQLDLAIRCGEAFQII